MTREHTTKTSPQLVPVKSDDLTGPLTASSSVVSAAVTESAEENILSGGGFRGGSSSSRGRADGELTKGASGVGAHHGKSAGVLSSSSSSSPSRGSGGSRGGGRRDHSSKGPLLTRRDYHRRDRHNASVVGSAMWPSQSLAWQSADMATHQYHSQYHQQQHQYNHHQSAWMHAMQQLAFNGGLLVAPPSTSSSFSPSASTVSSPSSSTMSSPRHGPFSAVSLMSSTYTSPSSSSTAASTARGGFGAVSSAPSSLHASPREDDRKTVEAKVTSLQVEPRLPTVPRKPESDKGTAITKNPYLRGHLLRRREKDGNMFDFELVSDAKNGLPGMRVTGTGVISQLVSPSSGRVLDPKNTPCMYGSNCYRSNCRFWHPEGVQAVRPCRYGIECSRASCRYAHPDGWNPPAASSADESSAKNNSGNGSSSSSSSSKRRQSKRAAKQIDANVSSIKSPMTGA